MRLDRIAEALGARVLTGAARAGSLEVAAAFAGTTVSELADHGAAGTLLVTGLANRHLLELAALLDVRSICFPSDAALPERLVEAARAGGQVLLQSPGDLPATCRRLEACGLPLGRGRGVGP